MSRFILNVGIKPMFQPTHTDLENIYLGILLLLVLLSAFWPKYLSGRKALWYFFHGKNSQVHYKSMCVRFGCQEKLTKLLSFESFRA